MKLFTKFGITGGVCGSLGILIGFVIFPLFLDSQVKKQKILKQGSQIRELWEDIPFPLDFKIYLFNITNPAEIEAGAKPIVQEVGPFFYEEYKQKVNVIDREEDDTVEFSFKLTWHFNKEKSGAGLSENTVITFPHLLMLSAVMSTVKGQPGIIRLIEKGMDSILHNPNSVFVKTTARQLLWDGLPIDCSVTDFAGSGICSLLRQKDDSLLKDGENFKFALFGPKNGTISSDRIRVQRGFKDVFQVGFVTEFNGESKLNVWHDEGNCNTLNGTDSTIFHPYLYKDEDIVSFAPDVCRSLGARFQNTSNVAGIPSNRYTVDFGDMSTDPELKCFCPTNTTCLKKGLMDLSRCKDVPLIASLPHLYLVDEEYLSQVDGLHPNAEEHEVFLEFEPMTGTPMSARKRLQFNMFIHNVTKFHLMKTFPTALLPLFWVEEGILLGDDFLGQLKSVFNIMFIVEFMKWVLIASGVGFCGVASVMAYKERQAAKKLEITK